MKTTSIIHLGETRDLLCLWDQVRAQILRGEVIGFHTGLRGRDGKEAIFVGGVYRQDPAAAMRVILKTSAARMLEDETPPLMIASNG